MGVLEQSALLVAITSFAAGATVLARNVKNKLFLIFAILTMLISGWAMCFFLARFRGSEAFYRGHLALNIWLAPASLAFIHLMVRSRDRWSRCLLGLSLALSAGLSVALALHGERTPWVLRLIYFSPGVVVLQILQLMWIDQSLKQSTVAVNRRALIYFGGLLVLATSVMDHVGWMGQIVPSLGNLALTAYLFFLSQAITQQKFLNLGALFSRFLVLLTVALMLTGVYSLLFAWIEKRPALFLLNSFIVSFVLLTMLEPIRSLVGYLTNRLLTQKHRRLEQMLRDSRRKLSAISDPDSLMRGILSVAEQALEPEWGALYVLRGDGTRFHLARFTGRSEQPPLHEILATHPLLEHCRRLQQKGGLPVLLDQILESEMARSASRKQRESFSGLIESLRALHSNLMIPVFDGKTILGVVLLRVPAPPEPWGNNWGFLPVIYPYFEQAAQAMRSMEIFVRSREKERLAALGEMAAGLAHEIRNPLGAIKGAAQFLEPSASADRPESRFLNIILEEVDRLNHVVTQFLDYSKPPPVDLKRTDLSQLVEKTVEVLRPTIPAEIRIRVDSDHSREPAAMVSPEQIRQVLINLIQNSVKALEGSPPSGERTIRVSVGTSKNGSPRAAVIHVEDTGRGIKKEHLDKLFIPFFTTSPSGTGLGLSISQKIIEAHRGRIEVATEEGRFTRVSVILPCVTEHGSAVLYNEEE